MNMKHIKYGILVFITTCCFLACAKQDDTYRDFLRGGEILYIGRADSVKNYGGKGRIGFSWLLTSDPKITKCRIFWNGLADSVEIPVTRTQGVDTVRIILNNMTEGVKTFSIFTYDNAGNRSVRVEKIANVYGDIFQLSCLPRITKDIVKRSNGLMRWEWIGTTENYIGVKMTYIDLVGATKEVWWQPNKLSADSLAGVKPESEFTYVTYFKPEPAALDTFYSVPVTRKWPK